MPISVPRDDLPSVGIQGLAAPQIQSVRPDTSNAQLFDTASKVVGGLVQQETDRADNAAIMAAEAKLSQSRLDLMFNKDNGVYNKKGQDALDITNQALPQFDQAANGIGAGLTNQRQRDRYAQIVNHQRESVSGELNRYEFSQRNAYYDQVDQTNISTSLDGAIKYAHDPEQVAQYQSKGAFVIGEMGRRKGYDANTIIDQQNQFNSKVASKVIEETLLSDPLKAQQIYAQNASTMTAEDAYKAQKLLGTSVRQQMAQNIATNIWDKGQIGVDGLPALIMQKESAGKVDAVSDKGALGLMQLMPDTAKDMAKQLGVPYDPQRLVTDPHYNMALGTAYINNMVGRYNGNTTLAVAAYNAGPGNVDKWIKENGDPRTGQISDADWISKIPFKETRDYAASIASKSMPVGASASQKYASGLDVANSIPDPQLKKYVLDNLDDRNKAAKAQGVAFFDQAAEYVNGNGFASIPAKLLANIPAEDQLKLRRMDDYRRKGNDPITDTDKFQALLTMPPDQLATISLARDAQPYLSKADYGRVVSAFQAAQKGDESVQRIAKAHEDIITKGMEMAGILTGENPKAKDMSNLKLQQQYRSAVQSRQDDFFQKEGRKPSNAETKVMVDDMSLTAKLTGQGFLFGDKSLPLWQVSPEQMRSAYVPAGNISIDEIPADTRRQIVLAQRAQGITPSEDNIVAAYKAHLIKNGIEVKN